MTGNEFSGEADSFCSAAVSIEAFSFDCEDVLCTSECCNKCCNDPQDSSSCYSKDLMMALGKEQHNWEFKYHSNAYSFSPSIIVSMAKGQVHMEKQAAAAAP